MQEATSSKGAQTTPQQPQHIVTSSKPLPNHRPASWTNPRKRPHHHDVAGLFEPFGNDDSLREADNGKKLHAVKRSRAAEWPLKNTKDAAVTAARNAEEHNEKRSSSSSVHPSKFQEGSMNDRISKKPPSLYTKEEEAMEKYVRDQGRDQDEIYLHLDAGVEANKPSGMFRFGKALANAFKPLTAWPGMWKEKEKERSTNPEKDVMQERQAKAVEAYAELKKSGFKGCPAHGHREAQGVSKPKQKDIHDQPAKPFRDSGIDMDIDLPSYEPDPNDQLIGSIKAQHAPSAQTRHSHESIHSSQLAGLTEALLVPPPPKHRLASPSPGVSSARKPSLHFRKPSLQALKKATSQIHLSPAKKSSDTLAVPSVEVAHPPNAAALTDTGLKRQASKKDVSKHDKLSKKVSDLENKLQNARRELELSKSTAPPVPDLPSHLGRKPFKPGALPSLPSERNLSPHKDQTMRSASNEDNVHPMTERSTRHVAHDAGMFQPATGIHDVLEPETASRVKKASRPHEAKPQVQSRTPINIHKQLPKLLPQTPHNSPSSFNERVPPVPPAPAAVYFHAHPPLMPPSKITDHTSVQHFSRAPSSFLGPPASATSTTKSRSKSSRRGISPPPPSLASAKKPRLEPDAAGSPAVGVRLNAQPEEVEVDLDAIKKLSPTHNTSNTNPAPVELKASPEIDVNVDPVKSDIPRKSPTIPTLAVESGKETRLPEPIKEDFEWDDDVF